MDEILASSPTNNPTKHNSSTVPPRGNILHSDSNSSEHWCYSRGEGRGNGEYGGYMSIHCYDTYIQESQEENQGEYVYWSFVRCWW